MPAVAVELPSLRQTLTRWAERTPLRSEQVEALRLASYEAAANVVEHAYLPDRAGRLGLEATCRLRQHTVTVMITDQGRWRPKSVDPESSRGRGLSLIHALADSVDITSGPAGTTVRMTWTLDRDQVAN